MACANRPLAEDEGSRHPGLLHRKLNPSRKVEDARCAARQQVERSGEILGNASGISAGPGENGVKVRPLAHEDLIDPVHRFHVGIAARLAEHCCAFERAVGDGIEFAEELNTLQFAHAGAPWVALRAAHSRRWRASSAIRARRVASEAQIRMRTTPPD